MMCQATVEQHQLLDQSSLQLAMQLTPPASPVHYQSLAANGILTENKLVINGNTLPNISISDNISDTTGNWNAMPLKNLESLKTRLLNISFKMN